MCVGGLALAGPYIDMHGSGMTKAAMPLAFIPFISLITWIQIRRNFVACDIASPSGFDTLDITSS